MIIFINENTNLISLQEYINYTLTRNTEIFRLVRRKTFLNETVDNFGTYSKTPHCLPTEMMRRLIFIGQSCW